MTPLNKLLPKLALATGESPTPAQRSSTPPSVALSIDRARAALEPASAPEIAACLDKAGRVFGYPAGFADDEVTAGIWLDALSDIPADLLKDAVDRYINMPSLEARWFPRPGQLRALALEEMEERRADLRRLDRQSVDQGARSTPSDDDIAHVAERVAEFRATVGESVKPRVQPLYVSNEVPDTIAGEPWR